MKKDIIIPEINKKFEKIEFGNLKENKIIKNEAGVVQIEEQSYGFIERVFYPIAILF